MANRIIRLPLYALAAVAGSAALSGCKVGPNYTAPDAQTNEAWLSEAGSEAAQSNTRWWEHFNDPVLTKLVQDAQAQNLSLKIAGLRVIEARARRGVAVGQFFPQMQEAFGGIGLNQLSANGPQGDADRSYADATLGLQAAWELDFWGKFRRGIEAADADLLFTVADYNAVRAALAAEVATNYLLVRTSEERLVFARANVGLQTETLGLTDTRFRAGAVSELDVSTARATLASTNAIIPELEDALQQAKLALCVLLARNPSDLETELTPPDGQPRRMPDVPPQIAAGIPAELLRRRPDVIAAERIAAIQSAEVGIATADLYPSISVVGSTGFTSSNFESSRQPGVNNIFDAQSFEGFIGLDVRWPILNYGRIKGNIRIQDAQFEQAVAAYQETVIRAASDVEAGLSSFLRAKERAAFLSEGVEASKRSSEISLIQYRAGAVDFIRVNDAQSVLFAQQDLLVVAKAAIALGAIRTYRALGGGWEVDPNAEFVDAATVERMRARTDWGDVLAPDWNNGDDLGFDRPSNSNNEAVEKK